MTPQRHASSPLRIGLLGGANIARQFSRDVAPSREVKVVAVASRTLETAQAFASAQGIGRHHGNYEALLQDDGVDAIYLPQPNSLHAEWAIQAAAAGKHILCEKPLALNHAQAKAMFDAAKAHGVMLLEAYPYYFQPQTGDLLRLLREGAIGSVKTVQASFGFTMANPEGNIRNNLALGGGALLDAGSYPLSLIRLVMGCAPVRVLADASWADSGVDMSMSATLYYADGRRAHMACAMDVGIHRFASIVGDGGAISTEFLNHTSEGPGHPFGYVASQMRVRRGLKPVPFEDIRSPTGSGFRFAAEAFAKVIADQDFAAIERAAAASLDIAATLEALAVSAKEGRLVDLPAS